MKGIKWDARQLTKAAIITLTVLTLIYLINSMTTGKEKNADGYFSTPHGTNQKIMTVNQTTGEINFVDKTVQAINDELVSDYAAIKDAMKELLGNDLAGEGINSQYQKVNNHGILAKLSDRIDNMDTALDGRIKTLACGSTTCTGGEEHKAKDKKGNMPVLYQGDSVSLRITNHVLADQDCKGFPNRSDTDWNWEHNAKWCRLDDDTKPSAVTLNPPGT